MKKTIRLANIIYFFGEHLFGRIMLSCFLFCIVLTSSFATEDPPLIFEKISNKEGLNQNSVFSIIQDRTGFIWLGTSNGLIKNDGTVFKSYVPHPGDSTTLLNNVVTGIFEDDREILWVGTQNGLCLYEPDRDAFVWVDEFNKLLSKKSIFFYKIIQTKDRSYWLATSEGLYVLQQKMGTTLRFSVKKITQTQTGQQIFVENTQFKDILELADGTILTATNQGLFHLRKQKNGEIVLLKNFKYPKEKKLRFTEIFADKTGLIWVGTQDGLRFLKITDKDGKFNYDSSTPTSFASEEIRLSGTNITSFLDDTKEHLFIGTFKKGLYRLHKSTGKIENYRPQPENPYSISSNVINDIISDESGVIWLATAHGGVDKIDLNRKPFFNLSEQHFNPNSLSSNLISGILKDSKNRLWVGTFQEGMNISKSEFSFADIYRMEFRKTLENEHILFFHETPDRLILISTNKGMSVYDLDAEDFVSFPDNHPFSRFLGNKQINHFLQIDKEIWIAESNKLSKITLQNSTRDLLTGNFTYTSFAEQTSPTDIINVMLHDPKTGIWFGTRNGLYLLKKSSKSDFEIFRHDVRNTQSVSSNNIFSLYKDQETGHIWVGTFGGGLNKIVFDEEKKVKGFERITKRDGLPDNAIYSISEDKNGFLWLSTDGGIVKMNPETQAVKVFNMEDGLSANNFRKNSALQLQNGTLLMGGLNGLTIFNPLSILENPYPPYPVITDLKVLNESVYPNQKFRGRLILEKPIYKTKQITLPYNLNQVTFEFAAMHYAAPKKNSFRYQLEGADEDWIVVDNIQNFASYSDLQPGEYTFKLQSFNGDGLPSEEIQTVGLSILNPFYKTGWAYLLYFITLLLIGFFGYRYAMDMVGLRRRVAKEEREIQRIKELNEAKLEFFTDMSHELRTPLTLIISPLEHILQDEELPRNIKRKMKDINENGRKLLDLTNSLIDFRKVGEGKMKLTVVKSDLGKFLLKTAAAFQNYAEDRNIDFRIITPKEPVKGWFDPNIVERVLFNLLSNAFKYTPEKGKVEVYLEKTDSETACIKVTDTGKGMSKKELANIFERYFTSNPIKSLFGTSGIGLSLVKKLLDLHNGQIEVKSSQRKGTSFQITLPIGNGEEVNMPEEEVSEIMPVDALPLTKLPIEKATKLVFSSDEKRTLLIVEDNPEIQVIITNIFVNEFTVLIAGDGVEAYKAAVDHKPDLIISDVMMPNMSGFELSGKLKNDVRTSHIPLILLTALNDFESKKTGFEQGGDVYVSKPFSPELLELQVHNLLKTKQKEKEYQKTKTRMEPSVPVATENRKEVFLKNVIDIIEENYQSSDLTVDMIAQQTHLSYIQFYRKFKAITGINAKEYIRTFRLKKAAHIFKNNPGKSVSEVMYSVGFSSLSHFTSAFKKEFGMTPTQFKKGL